MELKIVSIHAPPRSGSTWLQAILESHPNITTRFQPLFSYEFKDCINNNTSKEEFNQFVKDLYSTDDPFVLSKSEFHKRNNVILPDYAKGIIKTMVMKNVHNHNKIKTMIRL